MKLVVGLFLFSFILCVNSKEREDAIVRGLKHIGKGISSLCLAHCRELLTETRKEPAKVTSQELHIVEYELGDIPIRGVNLGYQETIR